MAAHGVNCAVHYPVPIHLQKAYGFLELGPGSYPVAERCAREFLSLPMYPELTLDQIRFVVDTLKESLRD
jgi:dTDP-4-amino-4,6-dideoxygalactose transaminase